MDERSQALQRIKVLEAALATSQQALEQALKRIEALERRLALSSSKHPSTDSRKARKNRAKATPSGKPPGVQKGHKGHHRQMLPAEQVNAFILYVPTQRAHCDYVFEA